MLATTAMMCLQTAAIPKANGASLFWLRFTPAMGGATHWGKGHQFQSDSTKTTLDTRDRERIGRVPTTSLKFAA